MNYIKSMNRILSIVVIGIVCIAGLPESGQAQYQTNWLSGGAMHNWYSEIGAEIEHGLRNVQQFGLRWPGIYQYQDMQAAKALWIGARNYTEPDGRHQDYKVIHVGPRASGAGNFFPVEFTTYGKFNPPLLAVDGLLQLSEAPMDIDEIDPDLPSDFMIYNRVNSAIGLTMERRIYQWSADDHDNYHIMEYTFTNTGKIDGTENVQHEQTLEDVMFFFQHRLSVVRETRYLIGNHTGWGRNAMVDARGIPDIDPDDFEHRAQFIWHGYEPTRNVPYNNIGAPIFFRDGPGFIDPADTVGRLGAPQFVGVLTIHTDASPADNSNDWDKLSTTRHVDSDMGLNSGNDPFNPTRMRQEYELMTSGHANPRHAYRVEPSGDFAMQTADPRMGTSGGFSIGSGYGPYTIAPGESVRIIVAEGASGLSRDAALEIGIQYKDSDADDNLAIPYEGEQMTKNQWVMTGRDSLFQTFERAIANYESGYTLPEAPLPPSSFQVNSGGDRIGLQWERPEGDIGNIIGYRIHRARDRFDGEYTMIHEAGPNDLDYDDTEPLRGSEYYYYIQTVAQGQEGQEITSSRMLTQTFDPAFLRRPAGESLADIRVVPNPYDIRGAQRDRPTSWGQEDRLFFLDVPGRCRIRIYTELGELIETIHHDDGTGDAMWNLTTEALQVVVSGVYIAVFEDLDTGERTTRKFVIIR